MTDDQQGNSQTRLVSWILVLADIPRINNITDVWKIGKRIIRGLSAEGVYEVLDHESTLELKDKKGE